MSSLDHDILRIALPAIVANITVPLLGLVDVTIAGHIGSEQYLGAIAVGSMIFNVVYWVLGFLRMGTSGLTAQAYGKNDSVALASSLWRSLIISESLGLIIITLRKPFFAIAMYIMSPKDDVVLLVADYYNICIWGAPAMLGLYSLTGWLVGKQDTRVPMVVAIVQNIVNIAISFTLVEYFGMKIKGIAIGTLIAIWAGFIMALICICVKHRRSILLFNLNDVLNTYALKRFFSVNVFIFLRTVCLVGVNMSFVAYGSRQGTLILAVNTLLMQFFTIYSYIMDGFAYAGEALCGYAMGQNVSEHKAAGNTLPMVIRRLFMWGIFSALLFSSSYILGGNSFLSLLTDQTQVVSEASHYFYYASMIPIVGVTAFVWDGVFIGITDTKGMLGSCLIASLTFAGVLFFFSPLLANHALWMAYLCFLLMRGVVQTIWFRLKNKTALYATKPSI